MRGRKPDRHRGRRRAPDPDHPPRRIAAVLPRVARPQPVRGRARLRPGLPSGGATAAAVAAGGHDQPREASSRPADRRAPRVGRGRRYGRSLPADPAPAEAPEAADSLHRRRRGHRQVDVGARPGAAAPHLPHQRHRHRASGDADGVRAGDPAGAPRLELRNAGGPVQRVRGRRRQPSGSDTRRTGRQGMRRRSGGGRTGNRREPEPGRRGRPPAAGHGALHRPRRRGLPVLHGALDAGRGDPPQPLSGPRVLRRQEAEPAARPLSGHPRAAEAPVAPGEGSGSSRPRHDGSRGAASDRHRAARPEPVPAPALAHPGVRGVSQRETHPGSSAGDRRAPRPAPALARCADSARSRTNAHTRPAGPGGRLRSGRPDRARRGSGYGVGEPRPLRAIAAGDDPGADRSPRRRPQAEDGDDRHPRQLRHPR